MATIDLQCNSLSQTHSDVYFRLKIILTGRGCMGEVLIQFCKEISKLFDKQVNAQKQSLKNTSGVHASQAHEKVCNENKKQRRKTIRI